MIDQDLSRVLPLEDSPNLLDESGPIFVYGCPRSGTTILAECLGGLPMAITQVGILSPDRFMHLLGSGILTATIQEHLLWNQRYIFWRAFLAHYLSRFDAVRHAVRSGSLSALSRRHRPISELLFIYKEPFMGLAVEAFASHFTRSKFIHIIRDGRDCSDSMRRTYPDALQDRILGDSLLWRLKGSEIGVARAWEGWYLPWWVDTGLEKEFIACDPLSRYLWMWQAILRRGLDLRRTLGPDRLLEIRYEDFCTDPVQTGSAILKFLNTPSSVGFWRTVKSITPKSVGLHRRWGEQEVVRIQRAGEPILSELGYSKPAIVRLGNE